MAESIESLQVFDRPFAPGDAVSSSSNSLETLGTVLSVNMTVDLATVGAPLKMGRAIFGPSPLSSDVARAAGPKERRIVLHHVPVSELRPECWASAQTALCRRTSGVGSVV